MQVPSNLKSAIAQFTRSLDYPRHSAVFRSVRSLHSRTLEKLVPDLLLLTKHPAPRMVMVTGMVMVTAGTRQQTKRRIQPTLRQRSLFSSGIARCFLVHSHE